VLTTFSEGEFIGEIFEDEDVFGSNVLMAEEESVLWKIEKEKFYALLSDNSAFAKQVIDHLEVA